MHLTKNKKYMLAFSCSRDYLNITNEKNQGFGVYCGQGSGNEINVTGTSVFITFHTENATQSRGFKLHFKSYVAGKFRDATVSFSMAKQSKASLSVKFN